MTDIIAAGKNAGSAVAPSTHIPLNKAGGGYFSEFNY